MSSNKDLYERISVFFALIFVCTSVPYLVPSYLLSEVCPLSHRVEEVNVH